MSRTKVLIFSFSIPITEIFKEGSKFSSKMIGELIIHGKGRIDPEYETPPKNAADLAAWIKITFDLITYKDTDIRPVFNLPDAKPLLASIVRAAENHVLTIVTENL